MLFCLRLLEGKTSIINKCIPLILPLFRKTSLEIVCRPPTRTFVTSRLVRQIWGREVFLIPIAEHHRTRHLRTFQPLALLMSLHANVKLLRAQCGVLAKISIQIVFNLQEPLTY